MGKQRGLVLSRAHWGQRLSLCGSTHCGIHFGSYTSMSLFKKLYFSLPFLWIINTMRPGGLHTNESKHLLFMQCIQNIYNYGKTGDCTHPLVTFSSERGCFSVFMCVYCDVLMQLADSHCRCVSDQGLHTVGP